ncbi:TRIO and F-actin-binding protein isoform X2 [Zalophus californianus]|uniref:TRIO and F-actin-binding protein isoform X2 n=1 Tax=Zalophus californianus TaxID=9704 RepID=A0A6P9EW02_ZALCA|nr:TRIO and F-actin-binding protein isoform X2 [Zalophus californianus]
MEEVAGNAPCEYFEANVLAQSSCQNCFYPEEAHSPRHQEPGSPPSAGVPYCDLPRRLPASEDPPHSSASGCQSVVGPGLGPGPERGQSAGSSAEAPAEAPTAAPGHRSQEPETVPYLGVLASSLGGSFDEGPESGTSSSPDCDTPDDTSDSSSVDWDTVERPEEACSGDELTVMIPRKPQEGPRADSARRAPSLLTRSPVGGDTAGQRKEDTCSGSRSAGQHWAKLRGESGYFLERHRSALTPASCETPQGGPRSATPQASSLHCSAQRDVAHTASTQFDTPQASSPTQIAQRDKPKTSSTQQDMPRTSLTQHNTLRASSPSRIAQRDNPRTSFVQRNSPRVSSPTRATRQDNSRTSSIQQDNPQTSFPTCIPQRDNPRASSPNRTIQRSNPRTSCAQLDNPRAPSPNRATQRDNSRTSCAQRDNPRVLSPNRNTQRDNSRTSCAQRDNLRAPSPNRTTQRDNSRTSCAQRDNPRVPSPNRTTQRDSSRTSCAQRDNPRAPSPNRTTQRDSSRTSCAQRDNPRAPSPNRTTQRDNSRTSCAQRDSPRAPSPNRTIQRDNPRAPSPNRTIQRDNPRAPSPNRTIQRDNLRAPSPNRATQRDNSRTSCAQRDNPRAPSPNRTTQRDNPRASCIQQNIPRTSSTQRDNPKTCYMQWNNLRTSYTQRDNPQSSSRRDNPRTPSPRCCTQRDHPRNSPHRTNKDIPWASFPLRPTQTEGPRTSSPSRSKQSEVPWASIALRPTQGDRPPQTSSPTRPTQRDPPLSSGSPRHNSPSPAASSSRNPGPHSASRTSSPLYPATRGAPQTSSEPSQPPCSVCIGHRDAPRASSPPRYLQHDPFPFFPDPHAPESESPHHNPPYIPPPVCIGHRDAPRASSPPRHTQFDPFPFLPDTSDAETQSPQHDPPQFPPPVCIGYRDAPRASSPPRQPPEPSLLFQDLPRASTESLVPSTLSLHEQPHMPTPVCIGHRDAPSFSSPPRQAPEPSLFFQDLPGTSMESLAPSTDSRHGSPMLPPQVCIGHRDAPRASSPPRHPPSDLALLEPSPPPGSSGGSRGSAAPGETRHNLEREEYTVLADLPPPRRLAQREPGPQCSNGGRTRSPGRAEVERLFGQERRKSEAPGAFQARDEGQSQRPSQGQNHLLRRQPSPALSREVTKSLAKQAEPARRSQAEPPHPRSPERRPEGDRQLQGSSLPPRTSARAPERERRTERPLESGQAGPRQPLGGWQSLEEPPGTQGPHRHLERGCDSLQEGPGLGGWQGLGGPCRGVARAPEGTWRGPLRESEESWGQLGGPTGHRGQAEAWEEPPSNGLRESPDRSAQRGWGGLQELPSAHQPKSPPENSRIGPAEFLKSQRPETPTTMGWGAEGMCPHLHSPERRRELDGRDLVGLLGAPREGASARTEELMLTSHLPRLDWEGLLELLQAQLPCKDPAGHWGTPAPASGPEVGSPGTNGAPELEQQGQPDGWEESTLVNGQSAGQWPQSSAQPPSPACTATQWPKTKVTSGPETSAKAGLEELGPLGNRSPAEGPSLPDWEFQSEEPEDSEPSKGQDSLTDQKQADSADKRPAEGKSGSPLKGRLVTSWRMPGDRPTLFNPFLLSLGVLRWQRPDLLNFKKGWMSILDEPGEWKKHWFVLTDSSLKYYRDSTAEEADELDGEIDLRSCTDVTEYAVQRNYGFQIHTKDAIYTLSAMTSGIRRNWIEALRKTVRPTSAPDVTKLSDCNKENTLHGCSTQKGSLKAGEQRGGSEVIGRGSPRKADGQRPSLDYVELSPLTQGSPQRVRGPARTLDRPAKQEELERDLAQRSEERRRWFEATDSRPPETAAGEGPRRGLGAPLTEDQQSRLSEEIEKKWQELEKLPLRENKRVPLTALLNQSRGERRGPPGDSHEALEKEVQSLRAQLEAWRLQGEAPQGAPRSQEDSHVPPGYISQEACERSLAEMESSHQQVMEGLQRHHERELQRLQQEKEWLLAEETAATASAIEAMKKAYQEELSRELSKTRSLPQGPDGLRKQHQSDVAALKRELQVLSEQYSQKCLEIGALTRQAEEREHTLRRCQQEGQELLRHNQELHARLSEEIDRLRGFIASQGTGDGCGRGSERSSCELEVLLRVKENELQYLKKEVQCLRDELQMLQKDKRFTSGKYQDVYVELNHIKTRSEREIEQLKEHLRLAMAALQEKESMRNSLAE